MSTGARVSDRLPGEARSGLEILARAGYVARGLVYLTVGVLAFLGAVGVGGGEATDSRGALSHLLGSTAGRILLLVTAAGLAGMTLWRLLQAFDDTEGKGRDARGLVTRTMYLISALVHAGLAVWALSAVLGHGGGGEGGGSESWTARLLGVPFGVFLVVAVGAVVVALAGQQAWQAWSARFLKRFRERPPWVGRLGRAGYAARAAAP